MKPTITTVINTCSGDRNFLLENVKSIREISDVVRIPYCNHLYSGVPDDMAKMQIAKNALKDYDVEFIEFDKVVGSPEGQNTARWVGSQNLKTDYVLYLDADEIFEKDKITNWANNFPINDFNVMTFFIHFYSMGFNYRAALNYNESLHYTGDRTYARFNTGEKAGLLVKSNLINYERIFHGPERWIITNDQTIDKKNEHLMAMDGSIMLHHYAYVRSKEEMKRKVSNFCHSNEKPWLKLIEDYYSKDFDPNTQLDICHGYLMNKVDPPHKIPSTYEFDQLFG